MQIANDIASGKSTTGLNLELSGRVDYFDFELSDVQHLQRYTNEDWSNPFTFSDDLHRIEIDLSEFRPAIDLDEDWEVALLEQIDKQLRCRNALKDDFDR